LHNQLTGPLKNTLNRHTLLWLLCLICLAGFSQPDKAQQVEDADEHMRHSNFKMAIPIYENELKNNPENVKLKYKLGVCYLNTRINREAAVKYLELATQSNHVESDAWLYLGLAYQINNRPEDALLAFEKFKVKKPKNDGEVDRFILQCDNALKFMAKPVKVSFQNLGKDINSSEPDYYPYISKDETFMVFTSRRRENVGGKKIEVDGYRSSDIYQSKMINGKWTPAKNAGRQVNGNLDELVVGMRSDGMEMYVYEDHIDKFGDIYVTSRRDTASEFIKPKRLDVIINEFVETSGCLSEDGNTIFFARREEVGDDNDLYMSRRLPNGKWGVPFPLPENINTAYNEDNPFLTADGQTLYFASEGHNSMGGFDLFKTTWDSKTNTFSKPENLGYPINSTDDDKSISITADNRVAYISAFRPNGFGDLDIYRVKLKDDNQLSILYTGRLFVGDTLPASQPKNYSANILVTNVKTNTEYMYAPSPRTGRIVMALPVGKYKITITAKGCSRYEEELEVSDMGNVHDERTKNFVLKKLKK